MPEKAGKFNASGAWSKIGRSSCRTTVSACSGPWKWPMAKWITEEGRCSWS